MTRSNVGRVDIIFELYKSIKGDKSKTFIPRGICYIISSFTITFSLGGVNLNNNSEAHNHQNHMNHSNHMHHDNHESHNHHSGHAHHHGNFKVKFLFH